jgi:hypothetical protein
MHELTEKIDEVLAIGATVTILSWKATEEIDQIIREWIKEKIKEVKDKSIYCDDTSNKDVNIGNIFGVSEKTLEEKFEEVYVDCIRRNTVRDGCKELAQIAKEHFKTQT